MNIVIIDYGMGNVRSVLRGVEKVGHKAKVSYREEDILKADKVIFPGVGAFGDGMRELQSRELDEIIPEFVKSGRQLLAICVGMQLLFDVSEEHGFHKGLGLLPGKIIRIPESEDGRIVRKIPHIGWNAIMPGELCSWQGTIFDNVKIGESCYFVHSFMAMAENHQHLLAHCVYEGVSITAAVSHENVTGLQFHPEKSGVVGLSLLRGFLK
jgi:glutamine amidotransferase